MLLSEKLSRISWVLFSCLMLLGQAQVSRKMGTAAPGTCPMGSVAYLSFCYILYVTPRNWMDANIACQQQHGGHLVFVLSGSEAAFVASLIKSSLKNNYYVWIGLHDPTEGLEPNGHGWEWSSSNALTFRGWELIFPSNTDNGFCGTVTKTSDFEKWKNYDCKEELPYVCKFKV